MTDCWVFHENSIVGGSIDDENSIVGGGIDEESQSNIKGGLAVTELFKKGDDQAFSFWENLAVPFGLMYTPIVAGPYEPDNIETTSCENFDKLFFLSAKNLDKSKARKTRKKMTS